MSVLAKTDPYHAVLQERREERILAHLPLVRRVAHAFSVRLPPKVDQADLVSVGTLGLIRAVDSFDAERGVNFEVYAARRVREAILDFLRSLDPLPYSTRVKIRQLEASMLRLQNTLGRTPSEEELAQEIDCAAEDVNRLLAQSTSLRLYQGGQDRGDEWGRKNEGGTRDEADDVLAVIEQEQVRDILSHLIQELPKVERLVLMLYYFEGLRMKEIGELLEVTESRVSQIHSKALTVLRAHLREILGP